MKEYAFEHNVTTGEYGYALSTLEGVIQYLVESEHNLSEISLRNEQFWAHLRDGDLCYIQDIFEDESGEKLTHSTQSLQPTSQDTEDAPPENIHFWTPGFEDSVGGEIADTFDEKETVSRPTRPRTGSIRSISSGPRSLSVLHTRDPQGNNALLLACFSNNAKLVEYLLERQGGCGPRDLNNELRTPLMVAAMHGKLDVVKVLLQDKYIQETMEREDLDGNTALLLTCAYADNEHSVSVVEELINIGGARLRVSNHQGNSPLHVAAMGTTEGHKEVLRLLSKMMSKDLLIGQNAEGSTVFHLCNSPDLCLALIQERGANADIVDKLGRTPLMAWSSKCNTDMVKFLLDQNIGRLDQADVHGQSALHLACNSDVLAALPLSNEGNTKQVLDVLHMLLERISAEQLNGRDRDGNTALHIAAMRSGGCPLVELLLEKDASLEIYNKLGQRPVYVAKDSETINLLDGKSYNVL
jgi:ankyrin repeat protein